MEIFNTIVSFYHPLKMILLIKPIINLLIGKQIFAVFFQFCFFANGLLYQLFHY